MDLSFSLLLDNEFALCNDDCHWRLGSHDDHFGQFLRLYISIVSVR